MRYAIILDNEVVNIIEADSQEIAEAVTQSGLVIQSDIATNNWVYDKVGGLRDNPKPEYNAYTESIELVRNSGEPPSWVVSDLHQDAIDRAEAEKYKASIPASITRYQAMAALYRAGKKHEITTFLGNPGNEEALIAWECMESFKRDSDFIADLAPQLGMNDADIDQLFIAGGAI